MQIKRLIFPEILYGKRGDKETIKFYDYVIKNISIGTSEGKPVILAPCIDTSNSDENIATFWLMSKLFKARSAPVYYLPKDFSVALSKIDRELPIEYLPKKFFGYIQLAEKSISDDDGYVDGGFVYIGPAKDVAFTADDPDTTTIVVSYCNPNDTPDLGPKVVSRFTAPLESKKVSDLIDFSQGKDYEKDGVRSVSKEDKEKRDVVVRTMINAVLYINSKDPEIMKLNPMEYMTKSQRKSHRDVCPVDNLCTIPLKLLNWSYHDGRSYSVDSTTVETHMRWQPCGVNRSQVKLIWVKEHERNFSRNNAKMSQGD